eukprot:6950934-Pyramimonas_sp.AAC.1
MLGQLARGMRPPSQHDNKPYDPADPLATIIQEEGVQLGVRACVIWGKGDLKEVSHRLGFPDVQSTHHFCPHCNATGNDMHE